MVGREGGVEMKGVLRVMAAWERWRGIDGEAGESAGRKGREGVCRMGGTGGGEKVKDMRGFLVMKRRPPRGTHFPEEARERGS